MELIITEKPSVGRTIAAVVGATENKGGYLEGNGMLVSWCVGHLVELALPAAYNEGYARWRYKDLPIVPDKWQYSITEETKKQFGILTTLMNDERVTAIICATDAGREGELIFRLVYTKAECRKPVRRLWVSSMEESAIREGISKMRPMAAYDNLYKAALCRAQADWLIGMNATRLYSLLYGPTLHIGRVMTPTLAMISEREKAISAFEPQDFYTVKLEIPGGITGLSERFFDLYAARNVMDRANRDLSAVVKHIEQKHHKENPPMLYDLTTLQRDANKVFGYTAQQTLDYAQGLYEKKLLTYPRTDSRYLTHDMEQKLPQLAARVCGVLPFSAGMELAMNTGKLINDSKVSDHHAIIPTDSMPGDNRTVNSLSTGEHDLLNLVCTRLLCAVDVPYEYDETTVILTCGNHDFTAKGKRITQIGWQRIWHSFRGSLGGRLADDEQPHEASLPDDLTEGMEIPFPKAMITEGKTTPPQHHTEASILYSMETAGVDDMPEDAEHKGIGTPATRASILEKLIETKLIERIGERRKRVLVPTAMGKALASILPEKLLSPQLTAEWEQRLKRIEHGEEKPEDFMRDIRQFVEELTHDTQRAENADQLFPLLREKLGTCPKCGAAVTERSKGFMCENRTCGFALWKSSGILADAEKPLNSGDVKELLKKGCIRKTGLRSAKTHTRYDATLYLDYNKDGKPILRPSFDK